LVLEGLEAQDRGRLSEAIERYREAAKADPSMFEAHYNLAVTAHDSGRRAEAVSAYEAALTLQPGNTRARLNYGIALEESGRPREAAAEFVKVVGSEPTNVQAHFNLGNLYERKLGDPIRAKTHYRRVLELDPQHSQATAIRFWLEGNP
jgi:tetratricopeptide (TPR) repeat protein